MVKSVYITIVCWVLATGQTLRAEDQCLTRNLKLSLSPEAEMSVTFAEQELARGKFQAATFLSEKISFASQLAVVPREGFQEPKLGILGLKRMLQLDYLKSRQLDLAKPNSEVAQAFSREVVEVASAFLEAKGISHIIKRSDDGNYRIEFVKTNANPIGKYLTSAQNSVDSLEFNPVLLFNRRSGMFVARTKTHYLSYEDVLNGNVSGVVATHEMRHAANSAQPHYTLNVVARVGEAGGNLSAQPALYNKLISFDELDARAQDLRRNVVDVLTPLKKSGGAQTEKLDRLSQQLIPEIFKTRQVLAENTATIRSLTNQVSEVLEKGKPNTRGISLPGSGSIYFESQANGGTRAIVMLEQKSGGVVQVYVPLDLEASPPGPASPEILKERIQHLQTSISAIQRILNKRERFLAALDPAMESELLSASSPEKIKLLQALRDSPEWEDLR